MMQLKYKLNGQLIAERCEVAESFVSRALGLIGRSHLEVGSGLYFPRCNSIHMWMMRFPIDVVFLKNWKITSCHAEVQPWKLFPVTDWSAVDVLELPVGVIQRLGLKPGEAVERV